MFSMLVDPIAHNPLDMTDLVRDWTERSAEQDWPVVLRGYGKGTCKLLTFKQGGYRS